MDDQTGKEQAELIGWILGAEWTVRWEGRGVVVEPAHANKRMLADCPSMTYVLAVAGDCARVCEMIDEAVMRRADVRGVTIRKLCTGDVHYKIKRGLKLYDCDPNGYERRELDARLATLQMLREADGG